MNQPRWKESKSQIAGREYSKAERGAFSITYVGNWRKVLMSAVGMIFNVVNAIWVIIHAFFESSKFFAVLEKWARVKVNTNWPKALKNKWVGLKKVNANEWK